MARPSQPEETGNRRISLVETENDINVEGLRVFNREQFFEHCNNQPEILYLGLRAFILELVDREKANLEHIETLEGELIANRTGPTEDMGLIKEIQRLEERVAIQKEQVSELCDERDRLRDERDRFRDAVANLAINAGANNRQGSAQPPENRRSEKIPDPPILEDGKKPKFEDWLVEMRNKLNGNADRYNTEIMRRAYVVSRTTGLARQILNPCLHDDTANPYDTVQEMFDDLIHAFRNPHRQQEAQAKLRNLRMKIGEDFHGFLAEFLHLAGEAELPRSQYKAEFDQRLTRKVRELCIAFRGPSKTFEEYCTQAGSVVQSLNEFDEDAKRYRAKDNNNRLSNRPNSQNDAAPKDAGNGGTSKGSKLDDVTRDKLRKDGKCFYCKEPGHMTNTCPELAKKKKADLKNLEFSGNNDKNVEEVLNKEKV
jgi:hypothetical protein